MPCGQYERELITVKCVDCGSEFMARSVTAKRCDRCKRLNASIMAMQSKARRKKGGKCTPRKVAVYKPIKCQICGVVVDSPHSSNQLYCAECARKREHELAKIRSARKSAKCKMKISGGDGSGKWRKRVKSRAALRGLYGRLNEADIAASSIDHYLDPATTRVEWRH